MSERTWMPFYVGDYLKDTMHLSTEEHGAYMLLIIHYWIKGGLPAEDKRLASIARLPLEQWLEIRESIAEFFDKGWTHGRIDEEIQKAQEAYEKRANAGRKGGKNKAKQKQCLSNAPSAEEAKRKQSQPQSQPDSAAVDAREEKKFLDDLQNRLMEAGGSALDQVNGNQWQELRRPLAWLKAGCDFDLDVEPTIRRISARAGPGSISSWNYFEKAVMQAKADRTRPVPEMQPRASPRRNGGIDMGKVLAGISSDG